MKAVFHGWGSWPSVPAVQVSIKRPGFRGDGGRQETGDEKKLWTATSFPWETKCTLTTHLKHRCYSVQLIYLHLQSDFYFELLYVPQAQTWRPISLFSTDHRRWRKPMSSRHGIAVTVITVMVGMTVNVSRLSDGVTASGKLKETMWWIKKPVYACQRSSFNKQIPFSPD